MDRKRRAERLRRILRAEELESRSMLAGMVGDSPWQNPFDPNDLDSDGVVSPSDALSAINALNADGSGELMTRFAPPQLHGRFEHAISEFLDADGDGNLSAGDPLAIINALNARLVRAGDPAPDADQGGTIAEAQELDVTHGFARMRGVIRDGADVDYFKVAVTKSQLNVALFSRGEGTLSLTIEDASGAVLASATIEAGSHHPAKVDLDVVASTTYYLKVTGEGGPYAIAALNYNEQSFMPQPDSELGDDPHGESAEAATVLQLQRGHARVVSHIDTGTDIDVFALTATDGKLIVKADADFSLDVEISGPDGSLGVFNTSERNAIVVNVAAGTYTIAVTGSNSDTGVYRMRVGNVPRLHDHDGENDPPDHSGRPALQRLFEKVDADASGSVTDEEFKNLPLGRTRLADHVFANWDKNDDLALSLDEVISGLASLPQIVPHHDHAPVAPLVTAR